MTDFRTLIEYGIKAPSGHNSQAWKFSVVDDAIEIHPDKSRALPIVDPTNREMFISLGCAAENIVLAAQAQGIKASVNSAPDGSKIIIGLAQKAAADTRWLDLINRRQCNRGEYLNKALTAAQKKALESIEHDSSVTASIITDKTMQKQLITLVNQGNDAQMRDPAFKNELLDWIRFNAREVKAKGDGLAYSAMGNPPVPLRFLGKLIAKSFLQPEKQNAHDNKLLGDISALIVFSAQKDTPANWIELGRYFERMMLVATELSLAHSHFNQPIEVAALRHKFKDLNFIKGSYPCLLIRVGFAKTKASYSPRRKIDDVITSQ